MRAKKRTNKKPGRRRRRKQRTRGKKQRGGAVYRRKPTISNKIAEGASMFLSGPAPTFVTIGTKLAGQAFKGIKENYRHYKRRRR